MKYVTVYLSWLLFFVSQFSFAENISGLFGKTGSELFDKNFESIPTKLSSKDKLLILQVMKKINYAGREMPLTPLGVSALISYDSVQEFVEESSEVTRSKAHLLDIFNCKFPQDFLSINPTDAMLLTYHSQEVKNFLKKKQKKHPQLFSFFASVITKENETYAENKNKYVLYHAVQNDIYKYMYIHTKILELLNRSYPEYLMLRGPVSVEWQNKNWKQVREKFLTEGSMDDHAAFDRFCLLSTNHSIFSNMARHGESTLWFFLNNYNVSRPLLDYEKLFAHYSLSKKYELIGKELEDLTIESPSGVLLQMNVDRKLLEKTSYLSKNFGIQANLFVKHKYVEQALKKSCYSSVRNFKDDITTKYLFTSKSSWVENLNELQWRLILTPDLLLNPNNEKVRNGFTVKPYALDIKALSDFHEKVDALFEKIKPLIH